MADTTPQQTAPPAGTGEETEQPEGHWGGRLLDAAGVIAGVALVVMVADILSDGRLISRRIRGRRTVPEDETELAEVAETGDM